MPLKEIKLNGKQLFVCDKQDALKATSKKCYMEETLSQLDKLIKTVEKSIKHMKGNSDDE